ncbi:formylglycine-generating enzyme family protein [candidate division KSB1 bacterium]|nr:formylglycine-generating enzyme family protein [candidate division KSB1 bacterium]
MKRNIFLLWIIVIPIQLLHAQIGAVTIEGDTVLLNPDFTWQFKQSLVPELVFIQGGEFQMGSNHVLADEDEKPVHTVRLNDYRMSKTEVNVKQYKIFCDDTGYPMPEVPSWGWHDEYPIVNVTWHDAVTYCDWLSQKTGMKFHLPTEAQWEFAARGGTKSKGTIYSGSNRIQSVAWYAGNTDSKGPHPVGTKKANTLGLFDMSGNIAEWCQDYYGKNYYTRCPIENPAGPNLGTHRLVRGGSWKEEAIRCRSTFRYINTSIIPYDFIGFRLVGD